MAKEKLRPLGRPNHLARRFTWLCAFICFGGMAIVGASGKTCLLGWQARDWVATPCSIQNSGINSTFRPGHARTYTFSVDYRYTFNGEEYLSQAGTLESDAQMDLEAAGALSNRFPKGADATCYVNPQAPGSAVLDRTVIMKDMVITGFGGVLILGGFIGVTLVRRRR